MGVEILTSHSLHFEFATAQRIIFGAGRLSQVGLLADSMGTRILVVRGRSSGRSQYLINILADHDFFLTQFVVDREPTVDMIHIGVRIARESLCDLVIGIGGGSVIDAGKAIAALLTNEGDVFDYLEVIGRGKPLSSPPKPYIAIPTTAGTGAEVTRNAVLNSPEHQVKVSLRSPMMLPNIALIDPELTYTMPANITASTGLDALTQLIEAYVSKNANPLTDTICRAGIRHAARSLRRAYEDGGNSDARNGMALASLFGGMALANAKLGAVHGFAGPLGGMIQAPHGAICARLLPIVMDINLRVLKERSKDKKYLRRYDEISKILTGNNDVLADDGVEWVDDLCQELNIPPLSGFGLTPVDFPEVIERGKSSSSMKGNPIELTQIELEEILDRAI